MSTTERRASMDAIHSAIATGGINAVPSIRAPADLAKAQALTQAAIAGLGGPVFASMTDHKPVDGALAKALTEVAIQKQGVISVPSAKAPADRAMNEARTMAAITKDTTKAALKSTETKESSIDLAALQAAAQAEKDAKIAAHTFGGGDAKAGMGNILKEIKGQGGIIAVPSDRAPKGDLSLNHSKTLMEINALNGEPIFASGTDHKVEDKALTQAKMMIEISKKGETAANSEKIAAAESRSTSQALTMISLAGANTKSSLKTVDKPAEGMSQEQLASLQAAAVEEQAV